MPKPSALVCLALPLVAQGAYAPRTDLDEGRFLKAMAEAELQLKLNPSNALAWSAKAHALSSFLRFPEAIDAANRALSLNPNLAEAYLSRGMARGGYAIQQRNFGSLRKATGALDDLRRATELDPSLTAGWMSLGLAYQQMPGILGGSTRKALQCAERLRKVQPAKGDLLQGIILTLDKRWHEAEPNFGRALGLAPSDPQVVAGYLEALGSRETRDRLGETAQKARLVQEAKRLHPGIVGRAKGIEAICEALLDGGQPEEAWRTALEALPHCDAPSILHLELGKIAARSGIHPWEGLHFLDQAQREPLEGGSGGYPATWWRKGQILLAIGDKDAARSAANAGVNLDPHHPGLQELSRTLKK